MSTTSFDYVLYIHGTPDEVWRGLVEPEFTSRYWFHVFETDWKPGSEYEHLRTGTDEPIADIVGTLLEVDHPNRLVLSWVPPKDRDRPEKTSRVAFELSSVKEWPFGPWTCLRLAHTELEPDSEMLHSISLGWPAVLSGLKSVLESPDIFSAD